MQKTNVFRGIIALASLTFTLKGHSQQKPNNRQVLNVNVDSSVNPPRTYINYKSDTLYNIVLSGGNVVSLSVNGHQVPADSFYVYDGLISRMKAQIERDKEQAARDREQAVRDKAQAERDAAQAVRDKAQAERDMLQAVRDKRQAEQDAVGATRDKVQAESDAKQAMRDKQQAEKDKALVKSLVTEVVKEGLAQDEKSITSLILDESVFYINGKKQSDELQKKFRGKFIKTPGYSIHYHNGTMNVGRMDE